MGREIRGKLALPGGCLEDDREFAGFLRPRIQDVEGMCSAWGGCWVEEELGGLPSHYPLAVALSYTALRKCSVSY